MVVFGLIHIREEKTSDAAAIRSVLLAAFPGPTEADLVDKLREADIDQVSLIAEEHGLVGHILFTPAVIHCEHQEVTGMGLAPLAVKPEEQKQGIGTALVLAGLSQLRRRGCPFVVVLGGAAYYRRFGFERASARTLRPQWDGVPDEAFMVLVLDENAMGGISGVVCYRHEFDAAV